MENIIGRILGNNNVHKQYEECILFNINFVKIQKLISMKLKIPVLN